MDASATAAELAAIGITPEQIFYVFTWGFGAVIFFFFLGSVIGAAKTVIKKI